MSNGTSLGLPHVVMFPFMSKGHTIPMLDLSRHLHRRRLATITILTTPLNAPFIRTSLHGTDIEILELTFPKDTRQGLPPGIESTDQLPSMSFFLPFLNATKLLRPQVDRVLHDLPRVDLLISDGFHGWTLESARERGIPRYVSYGMGMYPMTMNKIVVEHRPHAAVTSTTEPFPVPGFPDRTLTKADLCHPFDDPNASGPLADYVFEVQRATSKSDGIIINSFADIDGAYADHWSQNYGPKAWLVGPLCILNSDNKVLQPKLSGWLDSSEGPVLYVAFGTQAEISTCQAAEIAAGLEMSGVEFLWVVRSNWGERLEERVGGRGVVVREWVEQRKVLEHEKVRGFMSHCGWNSVLESVCAGVPVLAWPMAADQFLNAKQVVEELGIGVRVSERGERGELVGRERIAEVVREVMVGENGSLVRKRAEDLGAAAKTATAEGESSWNSLGLMMKEIRG